MASMPSPDSYSARGVAELLAAGRTGDRDAVGSLLEVFRAYLTLIAERELSPELRTKCSASDLVQGTFLEAQRDFERFRGSTVSDLRAWLRGILTHNLKDLTRRYGATGKRDLGREVPLPVGAVLASEGFSLVAPTPTPSQRAMAREQAEALQRALQRLPGTYRRVIELRFREGCGFDEIGRLLDRSADAARKLWFRAVERLAREVGIS
jgi:RNA polymerase sigma-70 factor (ECF subfamily)